VPGSKVFFPGFFALAVSYFLPLPMRTLLPSRQCCQGAEISVTNHPDFFSKIITGITIYWFTEFSSTILVDLAENFLFGNTGQVGTRTNPGQTNPGQTNPGHNKPWTQ
jgi:hypothetical protein